MVAGRERTRGAGSLASGRRSRPMNPLELAPELFDRYFAFFRPAHTGGLVPARIKELARIKIASLNACNT